MSANEPAFPGRMSDRDRYVPEANGPQIPMEVPECSACAWTGLTKRELFAAMAMQGLLANTSFVEQFSARRVPADKAYAEVATKSVAQADALLAELSKEPT